ncbi:MAG: hypothetical protein WBD31_01045 [Rubripirellula sp.]
MIDDRSGVQSTNLFDWGQHAQETRAIAAASSLPKHKSRREQIFDYVAECGPVGCLRHDIANHFDWPLSSVCGPVLALLRNGRLIEVGKRESPYGSPAAVLVASGEGSK